MYGRLWITRTRSFSFWGHWEPNFRGVISRNLCIFERIHSWHMVYTLLRSLGCTRKLHTASQFPCGSVGSAFVLQAETGRYAIGTNQVDSSGNLIHVELEKPPPSPVKKTQSICSSVTKFQANFTYVGVLQKFIFLMFLLAILSRSQWRHSKKSFLVTSPLENISYRKNSMQIALSSKNV